MEESKLSPEELALVTGDASAKSILSEVLGADMIIKALSRCSGGTCKNSCTPGCSAGCVPSCIQSSGKDGYK